MAIVSNRHNQQRCATDVGAADLNRLEDAYGSRTARKPIMRWPWNDGHAADRA